MVTTHIAVGLDGSTASRYALRWAVGEALRSQAVLTVVTACSAVGLPAVRGRETVGLAAVRGRETVGPAAVRGRAAIGLPAARRLLRTAIETARSETPGAETLTIASEAIVADPVTALCHAADRADLLVLGSGKAGGLAETSVPGRVARKLAGRSEFGRRPTPIVIATPRDARRSTLCAVA